MVERIRAAARDVLGEVGLELLTTNLIAKRAGISVGSLYQYFPNKLAILGDLLAAHLSEARRGFETFEAELDRNPAANPIDALLESIYAGWTTDPGRLRIALSLGSAARLYPELAALDRAHGEAIARITMRVLRQAGCPQDDETLHVAARYLYGMHNMLEEMMSGEGDANRLLAAHIDVMRAFITGLRVHPRTD